MGMGVQGLAISAHGKSQGATAFTRELRRRSLRPPPAFQFRAGAGFRSSLDPDGDGYRVYRHRRDVRHARAADFVSCDLAPDYAAALARAYNDWAADYCKTDPRRLKFAAQIAMHDVASAVEEARRSITELGAVAVIGTPNPVNGQHLHDEACEPLWDALEELDAPIGFHPTGNTALKDDAGRRYVGHANFHPIAHAIRNP